MMSQLMTRLRTLLFIVTIAALSACTNYTTVKPEKDTIPPIQTLREASLPPYLIQVGDVLEIKFYLNPELSDVVTVRPDGMISTTMIQDVKAYGMAPLELQQQLKEMYKEHLKDPKLTVIVRSFAPNHVYVLGEVGAPGELVSVGPNLTLLQAISRAGGLKNSADQQKIIVLRKQANGVTQALEANYTAAVSGSNPSGDWPLAPFDVVFVPRTGIADVYLYYQQHVQQFVPPSFGVSYNLNNND